MNWLTILKYVPVAIEIAQAIANGRARKIKLTDGTDIDLDRRKVKSAKAQLAEKRKAAKADTTHLPPAAYGVCLLVILSAALTGCDDPFLDAVGVIDEAQIVYDATSNQVTTTIVALEAKADRTEAENAVLEQLEASVEWLDTYAATHNTAVEILKTWQQARKLDPDAPIPRKLAELMPRLLDCVERGKQVLSTIKALRD